jgi:hypothetical protein
MAAANRCCSKWLNSPVQLDAAAAFFALHESEGFVIVGGAALITLKLVDRLTEDLDFFVSIPGRVEAASKALIKVAELRDWPVACYATRSRFNDSKSLAKTSWFEWILRSIQLHAYQ